MADKSRVAAMTYVYNEADNLPVWVSYYSKLFGRENLYIIDHGSDDDSTLFFPEGAIERMPNIIRIPRTPFDDVAKSAQMSAMQALLLRSYDVVVAGDCDELLVADPARFADLNAYIMSMGDRPYVTAMGMNVTHILTHETPFDVDKPVLGQRRYWCFASSMCKTLLSRVPLEWSPGLHAHKLPPRFDPELFIVHTKLRDYGLAMKRQAINRANIWSDRAIEARHGTHHRFSYERFVSDTFLHELDQVRAGQVYDLDVSNVLADLESRTVCGDDGFYQPPFGVNCMFLVPERFYGIV